MNPCSKWKVRSLLALLASASLICTAVAQTAPAANDKKDDTVKLDTYVVTGSYIPAAADEAKSMPVQIVDAKAIALSGVNTNVLDVLRKTVPQIQGGNNIGVENANIGVGSTNGGSQASLRNTDTLVLINGKRVASAPVAAGGGFQFVDLNLVPLSAVERIEVLTDGASAIYGSDAVSGVINIILKKNYQGAEVDFNYTQAPNGTGGYWRTHSVSLVAGAGNDKTNLLFSAEWSKNAPLWQRDIAYDNPSFGTASYPGVIQSPTGLFYNLKAGLNSPPTGPTSVATLIANGTYVLNPDIASGFNLSRRPTVRNAVDKRIGTVNLTHAISDQIMLNADFLYAQTNTRAELNPQPVSQRSTTLIANGVSKITETGWTIRNRFLGFENRKYDNTTNFYRGTIGLTGKVNENFNWEVYANYNLSTQVALGKNLILNSALLDGIKTGNIDLFAITQDPVKMAAANIFGTSEAIYRSQLYVYDAIANGKIMDLPAGPIQYAAGVEYRKEALQASADYNSIIPPGGTTGLWNNGTSLAPFDGSRTAKSQFAEVKVPVFSPKQNIPGLYLVALDGAVRHEAYSDKNKTTVPKVSLRYMPINDEFSIRATYSKSFTEPQLYSLFGPSNSGFTGSLGGLNSYTTAGVATGNKFPNLQGLALGGSNPGLKPSTAKGYTAGFVYSPKAVKGLEITVDYYNIKQVALVGSAAGTNTMIQSVEALGPASPYAQYINIGGFPGQGGTPVTTPGQLSTNVNNLYVLQSLVNIGGQDLSGYDVNVKYTFPWKDYGVFTVDTRWAFLQKFFIKSGPTDPGTEYTGFDDYGTLPKSRSYTTIDWNYKGYGAALAVTHLASVGNLSGDHIGSYTTADIQFRYEFSQLSSLLKGVSMDIGCNNFFDKQPLLDRTNYASPPFDASAYSFFGRMYYMDLKVKF